MSSGQPSQEVAVAGTSRPAEQSFQVVNKKPNQAAGRRGGSSKEHIPSSSRSQTHSHRGEDSVQTDSVSRKKAHSGHPKEKDAKGRSLNQRHGPSRSNSGSSFMGKAKETNHTHHHSSRHRTSASSGEGTVRSMGKPVASKITSSNRFEKLDPDIDCESSSSIIGVSTSVSEQDIGQGGVVSSSMPVSGFFKGAEERRAGMGGRGDRSARGGRGNRRGASGRHVQEVSMSLSAPASTGEMEDEDKTSREDFAGKRSSKHIKFDISSTVDSSGQQDSAYCSGTSASLSTLSVDQEYKAEEVIAQRLASSDETKEKCEGVSPTDAKEPSDQTARKDRIVYEREALLKLKDVPLSKECPSLLKLHLFCVIPSSTSSSAGDPAQTEAASRTATEDSGTKPKHPTALSLIKDHDKLLGKVSLSPQRRSFQRGCSWKDKVGSGGQGETSGSPTAASPLSSSHNEHFSFDYKRHHGTSSGSGNPLPRGINHSSGRDKEHGEGKRDSRRNWESSGRDSHRNKSSRSTNYEEPEPEWMEFGPTDRYDVIELRGFEDEEESTNGGEESGKTVDGGGALLDSLDKDKVKSSKASKEESKKSDKSDLLLTKKGLPEDVGLVKESDNEFILDGFDFSTGVSICQELDMDEDDSRGGRIKESLSTSLLAPDGVSSPTQLSNALLKVLGVNGHEGDKPADAADSTLGATTVQRPPEAKDSAKSSLSGGGCVPANALTLEEVHARENIQANGSSGQGMAAFNKLIAAMESTKTQQEEKKESAEESRHYPQRGEHSVTPGTPAHPVHVPTPHRYPVPLPGSSRPPPDKVMAPPSIPPHNYNLEQELRDIEDDLSTSEEFMIGTRRLKHLRHMINKLDYADHPIPTPAHYPAHPTHVNPHYHQPHLRPHPSVSRPVPMDRDGNGGVARNWAYSDRQRQQMEWVRPSAHHIAIAGQHQQHVMAGGVVGGSGSSSSRSANHWAVEMEHRRIMELQQMQQAKKKEMPFIPGNPIAHTYSNSVPPHSSGTSSKPNISLLPTSVVRQMHSTKSSHQDADVPKLSGLSSQSPQVHSSQMHQHTESTIHTHPPGQPPNQPPHAAGLGDHGGYHHHHASQLPPRVGGPGHPGYPHKMVPPDSLHAMAYHPQYNMPIPHGGLPVQSPYQY